MKTGDDEVRRRIGCGDPADFLLLDELLASATPIISRSCIASPATV
jgi:hypothetical protein